MLFRDCLWKENDYVWLFMSKLRWNHRAAANFWQGTIYLTWKATHKWHARCKILPKDHMSFWCQMIITGPFDAKRSQDLLMPMITGPFDAKWSQDLLMPNDHRIFWCQMITGPFDAKWSQDLLMPNDHRTFWCQMITRPFDAKWSQTFWPVDAKWSQDLLIKRTNKTLDLLLIRCASKWSLQQIH